MPVTRRFFLLALAASPWVRAQAPRTIAYLGLEPLASSKARLDAFRSALAKAGQTVRYELRSAEGRADRLAALAKQLVEMKPALIVSESALTTLPLRQATSTLPIVMAACDDPLTSRFVRAMDKPGTNATGVMLGVREELPGPVELVEMMVPKGAAFAAIFNPANAFYRKARAGIHYGALKRNLGVTYHDVTDAVDVEAAFAAAMKEKPAGLVVTYDPLFVAQRARIVKLAAAAKVPVVFPERSFVEAGGAVSHGPSLVRAFTLAASFAQRILEGANPAELPIQGAGKYEIVAGRKAPAAIRKRADAVL
jgi:putative tryptophan/tyrosine transport system substrate-binding protein